ncbi:MAG: flippase [Acidimicrobiales bacterium]
MTGAAPVHESERVRADADVVGLARGGGLNLAGALFTQAAFFVINLLLARTLGQDAVGIYAQAFALLALLELLSLSGFRAGLTRFVAIHVADRDPAALRGTVRLGLAIVASSSTLIGVAVILAAPWLADVAFDDPAMLGPLRVIGLSLPAASLAEAALSATQGFRTMRYFAGVRYFLVPGTRVFLTAVAVLSGLGLEGAMTALLASSVAGAFAALVALRRLLPRSTTPARYEARELFRFSAISWMSSIASTGLLWADTVLLGIFLPSAEVGVYQIASRLVLLATLAATSINASFAPRIADLWRRGRLDSLERSYVAAASWILRLSLPVFVALVVMPRELLVIFGSGFTIGASVTVILVVGMATDSATGPCGLMLNHTGRVALNMVDNIGVLIANVLLNLYLIPRYGIEGAAVGWTISLVAVNLARLGQVRATMGMLPFGRASLKGLVAATSAGTVAAFVQSVLDGSLVVPVVACVIAVVYFGTLLALGISAEDRLVVGHLFTRSRQEAALRTAPAQGS